MVMQTELDAHHIEGHLHIYLQQVDKAIVGDWEPMPRTDLVPGIALALSSVIFPSRLR